MIEMRECEFCGAAVINKEKHDQWHESAKAAAAAAWRADSYNTPIL